MMQTIIQLQHAENIRDMGGYQTKTGNVTRLKKLVRSADLSQLSKEDQELLYTYGVRKIIDFRSKEEREQNPDATPCGVLNYFLPVFDTSASPQALMEQLKTGKTADEIMIELYRGFVTNEQAHTTYRMYIDMLLKNDAPDQSILFHCTAGKDRTGFAAALFLLLMDVDYDTIVADYLRTNTYLTKSVAQMHEQVSGLNLPQTILDELPVFFMAKKEYLDASFDQMMTNYGSTENFLTQALQLTPNEKRHLQAIYLT